MNASYSFSVLNLERRPDRRELFIDHHLHLGYDIDSIYFHKSRDGADYIDNESMYKSMIELYPQLKGITIEDGYLPLERGDLGYIWGCCELLQAFIDGTPDTEFTIFIQDDCFLRPHSVRFDRILEHHSNGDPAFSCLKLHWWDFEQVPKGFDIEGFNFIAGWHGYGDRGILMNRQAAQIILDQSLAQQRRLEYINVGFKGAKGFYSLTSYRKTSKTKSSVTGIRYHGSNIVMAHDRWSDQDRQLLNKGEL